MVQRLGGGGSRVHNSPGLLGHLRFQDLNLDQGHVRDQDHVQGGSTCIWGGQERGGVATDTQGGGVIITLTLMRRFPNDLVEASVIDRG